MLKQLLFLECIIGTVTCLFTGLPVIVTGHNNVKDAFVPDNFDYFTGTIRDSFNDEKFPV